jgi:hypothetical protein
MGSNDEMTRKDFLTLTFTLLGGTVVGGACSSDNNNVDGGFGGTFGNNGGTFGRGGRGGTTGGGGTTGAGGTNGAGGTTGTAGTTGAGGNGAAACTNPLPESQVPDTTGHTHSITIPASMVSSTTAQTFDTSIAEAGTAGAHMHMVTLTPTELTTLKNGGNVTVMSNIVMSHGHMFMISCT